ncbi:MAG: HAMP domain-containing sensor histidine kinase, partial [Bacteroidota bacterium]
KKRSNALLEVRNAEVSKQKEEILDQRNELQDLNSLKDRIFSIVAHDLRNPINSLQGLLSMVQEDGILTPDEMTKYFGRLSENVKGVANLLNNLLYWARSQMEGSLKISPELCDLKIFIDQVIFLFNESARIKKIETVVDLHKEASAHLYVDPEILLFLLRNLLSNAYKFSKEGGKVSIMAQSFKEDMTKIIVQDEGIGIDEATGKNLFKNFVESKPGTQSEQGSGLGMMLCREFVEMSGGNIGVESELGKGTMFWFTLPNIESNKQ